MRARRALEHEADGGVPQVHVGKVRERCHAAIAGGYMFGAALARRAGSSAFIWNATTACLALGYAASAHLLHLARRHACVGDSRGCRRVG